MAYLVTLSESAVESPLPNSVLPSTLEQADLLLNNCWCDGKQGSTVGGAPVSSS